MSNGWQSVPTDVTRRDTHQLRVDPITGKTVVVVRSPNGMAFNSPLDNIQEEFQDQVTDRKTLAYLDSLSFDDFKILHVTKRYTNYIANKKPQLLCQLVVTHKPTCYEFYISSEDYSLKCFRLFDPLYTDKTKVLDASLPETCKKMSHKYFEMVETIENSLGTSWEDLIQKLC